LPLDTTYPDSGADVLFLLLRHGPKGIEFQGLKPKARGLLYSL